jgi:predicted O-methyltransferase YrrM
LSLLNFHYLKNLVRHYANATRIDVLHSPFVFNLYQNCIAKENNLSGYTSIESVRTELLKDTTEIAYEDFGASNNSRTVKVSELAAKHLKPARLAQIMHRLIAYHNFTQALELGTSLGITSSYLAKGEKVHLNTIEGSKSVWEIAQQTFQKTNCKQRINSYQGTFDEVLPTLLAQNPKYDLIFIDGNHSYEATLRYVKLLKPYLQPHGLFVLDDIYWSPGMTKAWEALKPEFTVSIDLFFIGILSPRTEQVKEDFQLRIW